jgi:hypothetical protein
LKFAQHLCGDEQILLIESVRIRMAEARRRRAGVEQKFNRILCVTESLSPSYSSPRLRNGFAILVIYGLFNIRYIKTGSGKSFAYKRLVSVALKKDLKNRS